MQGDIEMHYAANEAAEIESEEELISLMERYGVDHKVYGSDNAKSLKQLLDELKSGESTISVEEGNKLIRNVRTTQLLIVDGDKALIETMQRFHATKDRGEWTRTRNCALAEKCIPGESPEASIDRALKEELGIERWDASGLTRVSSSVDVRESASYPGLLTRYTNNLAIIDKTKARISIPDNYDFTEYFETGLPRLTSTWRWIPVDRIDKENHQLTNIKKLL